MQKGVESMNTKKTKYHLVALKMAKDYDKLRKLEKKVQDKSK